MAFYIASDKYNGLQNNKFIDSSGNDFRITPAGNVAQGTFSPFSLADGQWSNYFDGSGDYLTVPDSTAFDLNGQAFTIEMWLNPSALPASEAMLVGQNQLGSSGEWDIRLKSNGYIVWPNFAGTALITSTSTVSLGVWTHIAITSNGSTTSMYKDGVYQGQTSTAFVNSTRVLSIAAGATGTAPYTGYISNLRIVKGTALYTTNFTPPTAPLTAISNTSLLTCQSNRFKDNSSNNFTITPAGDTKVTAFSPFAPSAAYSASTNGGSAYFDGTGDYLSSPSLGNVSGDFTVEFWMYATGFGSATYGTMVSNNGNSSSSVFIIQLFNSANPNRILGYVGNFAGDGNLSPTLSQSVLNRWVHLAIVRSGSTVTMYENGVSVATATNSNTLDFTSFYTGAQQYNGSSFNYWFQGYLTNVRLVNGTAVYTANFTPPTSPLTAITNTQLLLNCTNAGIIDNAGKNDIETVGNAQISTSVKKYGTGSISFGAVQGNYIRNQSSELFAYGTGDFTIEFWVYLTTTSGSAAILFDQRTADPQIVPTIYQMSNTIYYHVNGATRISGTSNTANTWIHVSVCRSSGSTKMFVNGTQVGSTYTDTNNYIASPVYCGCRWDTNGPVPGYMDDIRVTKGQALYTANFTPPTSKLTASANTALLLSVKESPNVDIAQYFAKISDYSMYLPLGGAQAFGNNFYGQLGIGNSTNVSSPVTVTTSYDWRDVEFLRNGRGLLLINQNGELFGSGGLPLTQRFSPTQVGALRDWSQVCTVGGYSFGIRSDGSLYSCGYNANYGVLGHGDTASRSSPTQVGTLKNWQTISSASNFAIAIKLDGTMWGWGFNLFGQAGVGFTGNISSPVQIGTSNNWKTVACADRNGAAIKSDGTLWQWGQQRSGAIGDGTTAQGAIIVSPIRVGTATNWNEVSCGYMNTLATKTDGTLWSWGAFNPVVLGLNTSTGVGVPTQVGNLSNWSKISAGPFHCSAIKTDGTLWVWGTNTFGQLGLNTLSSYSISSPTQVGNLSDWSKISVGFHHTLAIKTDGTLWSWGGNSFGQLGLSDRTHRSSPVQVGTLSNWSKISAGGTSTSFAIDNSGKMWSWGSNGSGQLGLNYIATNFPSKIFPYNVNKVTTSVEHVYSLDEADYKIYQTGIQDIPEIDTSVTWKTFNTGNYHFVGIKTNGTAWSIGNNSYGQLGLSDATYRSSLTQIGTASNWSTVYCSDYGTMIVDNSMNAWVFGKNDFGQLGFSDTTNRYSPVQIVGVSQVTAASMDDRNMWVIDANKTLWETGFDNNVNWVLDNTYRISPVQVGFKSWQDFSAGYLFSMAVNSDGTLWGWGINSFGQLGTSDTTTYSFETKIGNSTDWKNVACGQQHTAAIKTNGTLWAWGNNSFGQLGTSDLTHRSSPVQIGTLSNWSKIYSGVLSSNTLAIKTDGTLWGWGFNGNGNLATGDATNRSSPVQIGTLSNWSKISIGNGHTTSIKTDGTLWGWGKNGYGQLGVSGTTTRFSPIQIGTDTNWFDVASGCNGVDAGGANLGWDFTLATKTDGTLWGCGFQAMGVLLGNANGSSSSILTALSASTDWYSIFATNNFSMSSNSGASVFATKSDGTMWAWGNNRGTAVVTGQLGVNTSTTSFSSPVQIGTSSNWSRAFGTAVASVGGYSFILNSNGTLYSMGLNGIQLGLYAPIPFFQQKSISNDTYNSVSSNLDNTLFTKTDGTVWAVGNNSFGVLGLNNITSRSSPVQIGTINNVVKVKTKNNSSVIIIK